MINGLPQSLIDTVSQVDEGLFGGDIAQQLADAKKVIVKMAAALSKYADPSAFNTHHPTEAAHSTLHDPFISKFLHDAHIQVA